MNDLEIRTARAQRTTQYNELTRIVQTAERDKRDLSATEAARFDVLESSIKDLDAKLRVAENPSSETSMNAPISAVGGTTELPNKARNVGFRWYAGMDRGDVYDQHSKRASYFLDTANQLNDNAARERLTRNSKLRADEDRRNGVSPLNLRSGISTTNGQGGEFVPPLWLESKFVEFARPARVTADLCTKDALPAGTDSINLPKVSSGTAVSQQITQNTGITEQDIQTTSVSSSVITIAGGQTISLQLVEQSPLNIDILILQDLARAYAGDLDTLVLSGSGTGGVAQGITTLAGIHTGAYTTDTLTGAGGVYNALVTAIAQIQTTRFDRPNAIVTNPLTWANWLTQVDGYGRPVIVPSNGGAQNAFGTYAAEGPAQGAVGWLGGLPVYLDSLLTATDGVFIVAKFDDFYLWESDIRAEAFQQTYAQNMSLFVRLYNYASFQPARYPQSIAVVTGPAGA